MLLESSWEHLYLYLYLELVYPFFLWHLQTFRLHIIENFFQGKRCGFNFILCMESSFLKLLSFLRCIFFFFLQICQKLGGCNRMGSFLGHLLYLLFLHLLLYCIIVVSLLWLHNMRYGTVVSPALFLLRFLKFHLNIELWSVETISGIIMGSALNMTALRDTDLFTIWILIIGMRILSHCLVSPSMFSSAPGGLFCKGFYLLG